MLGLPLIQVGKGGNMPGQVRGQGLVQPPLPSGYAVRRHTSGVGP